MNNILKTLQMTSPTQKSLCAMPFPLFPPISKEIGEKGKLRACARARTRDIQCVCLYR